ncbi:undecaprenyl diphosphate synthase [Toxoplasma gondii MAS]|uniref:Alkyl transferase n=2 Tax=Toxoplasma gondii TaxID=5811 RepID=A0A086PL65_TOXGO|nr:undecaprenyl diphosphate synthase [Toxoplasma gondii p89]KFH01097.1 undecaprenyl diphosphate synthase [Toxoplasma gondii MAS]
MDVTIPRWQRWLLRTVKRASGPQHMPRHVAFIMDGNRRFARRNKEASAVEGHRAGAHTLSVMCESCLELGIQFVTVYAFALGNFHRQPEEVTGLLNLAEEKFADKAWIDGFFKRLGIRLRFLGDFSYLPPRLRSALATASRETADACGDPRGFGCRLLVTVCVAYGSRREIARALAGEVSMLPGAPVDHDLPEARCTSMFVCSGAERWRTADTDDSGPGSVDTCTSLNDSNGISQRRTHRDDSSSIPCCDAVLEAHLSAGEACSTWHSTRKHGCYLWRALQIEDVPPPDLLLRTSGERRLSDFLLYETSETTAFHFLNVLWPDLSSLHLLATVVHFQLQNLVKHYCMWVRCFRFF